MKKLKLFPILLVLIAVGCSQGVDYSYSESNTNDSQSRAVTVNKPFPQSLDISGLIKPNISQSVINDQIKTFYNNWKNTYGQDYSFKNGAVDGTGTGYIIKGESNGWVYMWPEDKLTITTSEAHGYGMIVFALMGGHDPEAKQLFDKMYKAKVNFPSPYSNNLMSWVLPLDGDLSAHKQAGATDGDMDIAYALLLADKQWGGGPEGYAITYKQAALDMIKDLGHKSISYETGPHFPRLQTSEDIYSPMFKYRTTRPSDFMVGHMDTFSKVESTTSSDWEAVKNRTIEIVTHIQSTYSPDTGLMPEFIGNGDNNFNKKIEVLHGKSDEWEGKLDHTFYYNACRFPWRYSMAYAATKDSEIKASLDELNNWIISNHKTNNIYDPNKTKASYLMDGTKTPTTVIYGETNDFNYQAKNILAGFMASLAASNDIASLTKAWNSVKNFTPPGIYGTNYYENSITLLSMLFVSGNWWSPIGNDPTIDTEPPTAPIKVGSFINQKNDHAGITWENGTDNVGVTGYKIIATPSWRPAETYYVDSKPGRMTHLIQDMQDGGTIEISICTLDAAGNESRYIIKRHFVDYDTEPPTVPTNIRGTFKNGILDIQWDRSTDSRSRFQYLLFIYPKGSKGVDTDFYDQNTLGATYDYSSSSWTSFNIKMRAVDSYNNWSAYTETITISQDTHPVISEDPAATGIPATPSLSKNNWNGDPNYKVTSNMYWGNNATVLKLYENNILIETKNPSFNSPSAQKVEFSFTGKSIGTYKYKVEAINQHGTTTSSVLTVNVSH